MKRIAVWTCSGFALGFVLGVSAAVLDLALTYEGKIAGALVLSVILLATAIGAVPIRSTRA